MLSRTIRRRRPQFGFLVALASCSAGLLAIQPVQAQQTVAGVVLEAAARRPLVGAQVLVEGTRTGALTDNRGRFAIPGLSGTQVTLRVVLIGYRELREVVQVGRTDLVLTMSESAVSLDQIIVTGTPQQQLKRALGNSVGKVNVAAMVEVAPPPTVHKLLSSVPGVTIQSGGGDVGAGAMARVRGASSLTLSSEPLVYVDGVRSTNTINTGPGIDSRFAPSRINDIDPDEIESIEIIKGPAAATLYGTEASNGVVNIITKRGRAGAPTVTFGVKQGANWLPNPEELFPPAYYRSASGQIVEFHPLRSDRITGEYPGDTIAYGPWFRTGHPQGYEGTLSGGSDALRYFFAGSWDRDEGPVTYNWKNRLNTRANLTYTPDERVSVDLGLGFIKSRYRSAGAAQPISVTVVWACPSPGCEPGRGLPGGVDGPTRGYLTGPPERYEQDFEGYEDLNRGILTSTIRHRPTDWLSHRLTVGGDYATQTLSSLSRRSTTIGSSLTGTRSVENASASLLTADYAATATAVLNTAVSFETAVGVQYYRRANNEATATGSTFPVRALETVSAGALKNASETFIENKTVGAFIQEQIAWKNRVFLTGAVRGDDNSAFGQNYDFVVYPKVSLSWVVSDESFFKSIPVVSSMKLRSAWGRAGQQPDAFAAQRTYQPEVGPGGTPTLSPQNMGNPDLKPEVGEELEVGFDASVFSERIGIEFTFYDKKTKDAIVAVPVVPSIGFPGTQFQNIGEVANRGFEVGIIGEALQRSNLGLTFAFKYSRNKNQINSLGGPSSLVLNAPFGSYNVTGFPLGGIFLTRIVSADLDLTGAVPRAVNMMCESGERVAGTNFSAGGGPPVPCAQAPAVYWGSPIPQWEGSVNTTLTLFKNLQLYGQVDFVGGHTLSSGDIRASLMSFRNQVAIIEARDPILLGYDVLDTRRQPGIIDAGFAKLRDVSATYTLPQKLSTRYGFSRASITMSAMNLWTIWRAQLTDFGVRHVDTEVRNISDGFTAYYQEGWPQLKRFLTTIRVTL
jgi:TonB-linked SusC/RagA family outer membrane protein